MNIIKIIFYIPIAIVYKNFLIVLIAFGMFLYFSTFYICLAISSIATIFVDKVKIDKIVNKICPHYSFAFDTEAPPDYNKLMHLEFLTAKKLNISSYTIRQEYSGYSNELEKLENPTIDEISKFCVNSNNNSEADKMQKYLIHNLNKYKLDFYPILEKCMQQINPAETINIVDFKSGQGMVSMIALKYIKKKYPILNIAKIVLIDECEIALNRAALHLQILKDEKTFIVPLKASLENFKIEDFLCEKHTETLFMGIDENGKFSCRLGRGSPRYFTTFIDFKNTKCGDNSYCYEISVEQKGEIIGHIERSNYNSNSKEDFLIDW